MSQRKHTRAQCILIASETNGAHFGHDNHIDGVLWICDSLICRNKNSFVCIYGVSAHFVAPMSRRTPPLRWTHNICCWLSFLYKNKCGSLVVSFMLIRMQTNFYEINLHIHLSIWVPSRTKFMVAKKVVIQIQSVIFVCLHATQHFRSPSPKCIIFLVKHFSAAYHFMGDVCCSEWHRPLTFNGYADIVCDLNIRSFIWPMICLLTLAHCPVSFPPFRLFLKTKRFIARDKNTNSTSVWRNTDYVTQSNDGVFSASLFQCGERETSADYAGNETNESKLNYKKNH